jgi:hypothetical protein
MVRTESFEKKLNDIRKELNRSSEDQLFLAVVFPLAVLFVTIPVDSLGSFFQKSLEMPQGTSVIVARSIVYVGFFCLLMSSAVRYYAAVVGKERPSKAARALSVELMIMAWDAILFLVAVSIILSLSGFLGLVTISLASLLTLTIFICMTWAEAKVLRFYASRFFIRKKDVTPIVSSLFIWLAFSLYAGFVITWIGFSIRILPFSPIVFVVSWLLSYAVTQTIYFINLRRKKRKRIAHD